MSRTTDMLLTAVAPAIWGSTYLVTSLALADWPPMTLALLRALPAGLLLMVVVRQWPRGLWWGRVILLGTFNFTLFWWLLFIAAQRLPGGVAATVGAVQPLVVLLLARGLLGTPLRAPAVLASIAGITGVALLILTPKAALDTLGLAAGFGGAASMAIGTVLTRKWQPPVPALTFTAWQLTAGGLLLLPMAFWAEPAPPPLTLPALAGLLWLGLIGAAFTYALWFRGIARIGPAAAASLGFLSPLTAVLLGGLLRDEHLSPVQILGITIVLGSVWLGQRAAQNPR